MDTETPVHRADGTTVDIQQLDQSFGLWVHTGRNITISQCNNEHVRETLTNSNVYPISEHFRGKAVLISNTGYQALRLLKDLFIQMNYKIGIFTEKTSQEMRDIISNEAKREENKLVDSFVVVVYGTPEDFLLEPVINDLKREKAPYLQNKPKLVYVIGSGQIVDQVHVLSNAFSDPDVLIGATGFNGMMFFIYVFCTFVHELSAKDIWKLLLQFANYHTFPASVCITLKKDFYFFPNASISVLPEDLANLDPKEITLYMKLLQEKSVKTNDIRLMFVGVYGAGKTSTARRIMGKGIDDVSSTDGIDVYIGKCRVDLNTGTWETIEDSSRSMPFVKLTELLRQPTDVSENTDQGMMTTEQPYVQERQSLLPGRSMSSANSSTHVDSNLTYRRAATSDRLDSFTDIDVEMETDSTPQLSAESMVTAARVIQEARVSNENKSKSATVSLWDFAGQFVYYATHQLFFSPRSIYLLVLNLEDDLHRTLDDWYMDLTGKESMETQGGVHFWLSSIYTYAKGQSKGVPPVILVGTHKDKLQGDDAEKEKYARKYFQSVRNIFHDSPIADHIRTEYVLLDNNVVDPNIGELKDVIMNVSKEMFYWDEIVPAKWIELEQALVDRRKDGSNFIKMNELKEIDKKLSVPLHSEDELRLFLRVHHEKGTIINFCDSESLKDVIILEPQWIINAFRHLIRAKDFGEKYGHLRTHWEEFNDTGKLNVSLAESIWKQDHKHHFYENFDMLLQFLEKLDIIVKASQLLEDGKTTTALDYYYVPCLLKQEPPIGVLHLNEITDGIRTPVLCFTFWESFLPPAVFNRIIALCIGRWPVARQGKRKFLFCGCAVFEVKEGETEDRHRLHIFFKKSKIGLRVSRYSTSEVRKVDTVVCDRIRRFIAQAIRREFGRFQSKGITQEGCRDENADPFFYQLQCTESGASDVLDDGLHDLQELENHFPADTSYAADLDIDVYCTKHSGMCEPHQFDPRRLLKEWFPDKIPERFRESEGTVKEAWFERLKERKKNIPLTESMLANLSTTIGKNWWALMTSLGVQMTEIEQEEMNNPRDVKAAMFKVMRNWACKENTAQEPKGELLLNAMFNCKDVTIDWEEVQNIFEQC